MALAQPGECLQDHLFLAPAGRCGDQQRLAPSQAEGPTKLLGPRLVGLCDGPIILEVSRHHDPLGVGPHRPDALGVLRGPHAEARHVGKHAAEKGPQALIPRIGPVGDAAVEHDHRNRPPAAGPQEVRPKLGLDEAHAPGPQRLEHPADDPGEIEREVEDRRDLGQLAQRHSVSGEGDRADDDGQVGVGGLNPPDEGQGGRYLTHADGVHPQGSATGEPLDDLRRNATHPLSQAVAVLFRRAGLVDEVWARQKSARPQKRSVKPVHGPISGYRWPPPGRGWH